MGIGLCLLAAGADARAQLPVPRRPTREAQIRKLQVERRDALRLAIRLRLLAISGNASADFDKVIRSACHLLHTELELAEAPADRLAAHQRYFATLKRIDELALIFKKAGARGGLQGDYEDIRAARLEAEIALLRAGGDPRKVPEWREDFSPLPGPLKPRP
jgi:hypothetical protein